MDIIRHLEESGNLESVMQAVLSDNYGAWIAPIIAYAQSRNESALGYMLQVIDHAAKIEEQRLQGV